MWVEGRDLEKILKSLQESGTDSLQAGRRSHRDQITCESKEPGKSEPYRHGGQGPAFKSLGSDGLLPLDFVSKESILGLS